MRTAASNWSEPLAALSAANGEELYEGCSHHRLAQQLWKLKPNRSCSLAFSCRSLSSLLPSAQRLAAGRLGAQARQDVRGGAQLAGRRWCR